MDMDTDGTCRECDSAGVICDGEGTTLANLQIAASFYRFSNRTAQAYECPLGRAACLGTKNSTHPRGCSSGHTGPLCGVCVRGFFLDGVRNKCVECSSRDAESVFVFLGSMVAVCCALLAVYACYKMRWCKKANEAGVRR